MANPYFEKAKERASEALKDNERVRNLLSNVGKKLSDANLTFSGMADRIKVLSRMVRSYITGSYRMLPWKSVVAVAAVLIYFIMPLDLIADFVPVTGYLDDFTLILWVFRHLQDDIETFILWEEDRKS